LSLEEDSFESGGNVKCTTFVSMQAQKKEAEAKKKEESSKEKNAIVNFFTYR
jgi:hypothetical protein